MGKFEENRVKITSTKLVYCGEEEKMMKKLTEYAWTIRIGNFKPNTPYFLRGMLKNSIVIFEKKQAAIEYNRDIGGKIVRVRIEELY